MHTIIVVITIDIDIEFFGPEMVNVIVLPLMPGVTPIDEGYTSALVTVVLKV